MERGYRYGFTAAENTESRDRWQCGNDVPRSYSYPAPFGRRSMNDCPCMCSGLGRSKIS